MDFYKIQSQKSLKIDLFIKNYLADRLKNAAARAVADIFRKIQIFIKTQSSNLYHESQSSASGAHQILTWSAEWFLRCRGLNFLKF